MSADRKSTDVPTTGAFMPRSRYRIDPDNPEAPHFLTCTIVAWLPIFARPEAVEIVLNSWRYLQENEDFALFGYVIMENHLHMIAAGDDLSKQIGRFKSYTARRIIDLLKARGETLLLRQLELFKRWHKVDQQHQLWEEGSHPQRIGSDKMMGQKLDYMHNNPVKRGYVDLPVHWRYSSARNYEGQPGPIEVRTRW